MRSNGNTRLRSTLSSMLCRYDRYALCSAHVRLPTSPPSPGSAGVPLTRFSWVVRASSIESDRSALGALFTRLVRNLSSDADSESSSVCPVALTSQYSSCTLRFHQTPGHGVFSIHGPQVAMTGRSRRVAHAIL